MWRSNRRLCSPRGHSMNSRTDAKKAFRLAVKMVKKMAQKDLERYQSMPLLDRLKVAYRIVFKC